MKLFRLLMLAPILNLAESLFDNLFRKTSEPARGSIVYCDLVFGYAEHSGIYIGNDRIVHRNGSGIVEVVSSRQFVADTTAITIYVSCDQHGRPVGEENVARLAEAQIGQEEDYALLA